LGSSKSHSHPAKKYIRLVPVFGYLSGNGIPDVLITWNETVHRFRAYLGAKLFQPTTHAKRYAATRQINGLSIVKPTAMSETKGPWVSMVLLER
jgi:hypothetical protein